MAEDPRDGAYNMYVKMLKENEDKFYELKVETEELRQRNITLERRLGEPTESELVTKLKSQLVCVRKLLNS